MGGALLLFVNVAEGEKGRARRRTSADNPRRAARERYHRVYARFAQRTKFFWNRAIQRAFAQLRMPPVHFNHG